MDKRNQTRLIRTIVATVIFLLITVVTHLSGFEESLGHVRALQIEFALYLIPYLIAGYDVIYKAFKDIKTGQLFNENFLMTIATFGAFLLVLFPESEPHMAEGAAVMLFFQVGELFEAYAVGKSRRSISEMMDIAPDYANVMREGQVVKVDPFEVMVGDEIIVKPGERVPLDGVVLEGASTVDTSALTGESIPASLEPGDKIISGCINLTGVLKVAVEKEFGESTVARIMELVENAASKKSHTESFISKFARYYTPIVVISAVVLAVIPPLLFAQEWSDWVSRALMFLVVSCPCALVISVPLTFFGGIGGASKNGILIKGSNYLEALARLDCVVFDKTGTLTDGSFDVQEVSVASGMDISKEDLLKAAAYAESYSDHPIALSIKAAFGQEINKESVSDVQEIAGNGLVCNVSGRKVAVGNAKLMEKLGISFKKQTASGTTMYVAIDDTYAGSIVVCDHIKPNATESLASLKDMGASNLVMLTGDNESAASGVASTLGISEYHAHLLPQDKLERVEEILAAREESKQKLAFVGDGINDAPVLSRADIGIAMGAMGSDAAIEAADIVLMDDSLAALPKAVSIAKRTNRIVWQNIIFALGVKFLVLGLAAFGYANLWMAVFADVGVTVIAVINAMRALRQ